MKTTQQAVEEITKLLKEIGHTLLELPYKTKRNMIIAMLGAALSFGVIVDHVRASSQDRIGIPQGETFTIVSPKKKQKCHPVFTWDKPPRFVKKVCKGKKR